MADHPSPCARQQRERRLRAGDDGGADRRGAVAPAALRAPAVAARARRLVAGHRRRSRSLHPVRPLRPRLQRDQAQQRHRPDGQGLHRRHRLRPRTADGQLDLRVLRRVHGLVPDRRADQQARRRDASSAAASRSTAEWILQLPVFKGVSRHVPRAEQGRGRAPAASRRARSSAAKGEFGSTAFYILEGTRRRLHRHADRARRSSEDAQRRLAVARSAACSPAASEHRARRRATQRYIPIDAPVDLPYDNPIAELGAGRALRRDDLHELLPALGDGARRRPTVVVLEMLRNVLDILQQNKTFRARARRKYRAARPRDPPARASRVLATMPAGLHRRTCATASSCMRFSPGEVIFRQGDAGRRASTWCASAS